MSTRQGILTVVKASMPRQTGACVRLCEIVDDLTDDEARHMGALQ